MKCNGESGLAYIKCPIGIKRKYPVSRLSFQKDNSLSKKGGAGIDFSVNKADI